MDTPTTDAPTTDAPTSTPTTDEPTTGGGDCGPTQRMCDASCADCPPDDGIVDVACDGAECVAAGCEDTYFGCGATCCAWLVSNVEQSGPSTRDVDVAIDASDRPHIVYVYSAGVMTPNVRHAVYDGFDWAMDDVDGTSDSGYVDIAIDGSDVAHVAYLPMTGSGNVAHAWDSGSGWNLGTVHMGSVGNDYRGAQVAVDSLGRVSVVYREESFMGEIYHAVFDGSWTPLSTLVGGLDTGLPPNSFSIDIAPNGQPHVAYYSQSDGELGHAVKTGPLLQNGGWTLNTVDLGAMLAPSVSVSSDGDLEIAYFNATEGELRMATRSGPSWDRETIWSDGMTDNISFDHGPLGQAHVAFIDGTGRLLHAARPDDTWRVSVVDDTTSADWVALAVDSAGIPHIVFHDTDYGGVRYATADPP
jgi:hypothetical protein